MLTFGHQTRGREIANTRAAKRLSAFARYGGEQKEAIPLGTLRQSVVRDATSRRIEIGLSHRAAIAELSG
jgi:hypothetical protein